jgi:hypothetical protein
MEQLAEKCSGSAKIIYEDLPCSIRGFAVKSKNTIVLNSNIKSLKTENTYIQSLADSMKNEEY